MTKHSPKHEIRQLDAGVFALYRNNKFVRSFKSKRAALKILAHVNEDTRKPAAVKPAATPHKFIVRYQLKSGSRRRFVLRAPSKPDAAALFFAMTGLKLGDLKSAHIAYLRTTGQPKAGAARELMEVL